MNAKRTIAGAWLALASCAAMAGTIQIGGTAAGADGMVSARSGVCTVTFNGGNAANACGATYTQDGGQAAAASHFRTGNAAGQYATPAGDTTTFMTAGPIDGSAVLVTLATAANYFGFYAGSLDSFNLVQFYFHGAMVDAFDGTQINTVAFPGQSTSGNQTQARFIEYLPGTFFDSLLISSSGNAFETDNHAFGVVGSSSVPEPGSTVLLALGGLALLIGRRPLRTL